MISNYINPVKVYKRLTGALEDLTSNSKYKKVIFELAAEGKLDTIGFSVDRDANLYLGMDLNPELLLYSETSQESVELKLISEKMKKYTDFLTKEGILDSVRVDYDRVKTEEYYGYVLQIKFNFTKYKRSQFIYDLAYFFTLAATFATVLLILI
jgi:hypothetical protein